VNDVQADGRIGDVTGIHPIVEKWQSFGWMVIEIDGNQIQAVMEALEKCKTTLDGRPKMIIANTIMGNGISSLHGKPDVHYVKWSPEQNEIAILEITNGVKFA
jgi:transketolase